jgi:lipid II:glycine glycyltransferase (peptidoglycan interpeptide bridge formation enzyme)
MEILRDCDSDQEWDDFQLNSPQGSVYMTSSFLRSLQIDVKKIFYEVDDVVIASAAISDALPSFSLYQGITLVPLQGKGHSVINQQLKILSAFLDRLAERFATLNLCLSNQFKDLRAFQWVNYHNPEKGMFDLLLNYTAIINLKDYTNFASYLESIRSVRRQEWKKGLKSEFNIVDSVNVDEFIRLYELTFDRQSISLNEQTIQTVRRITQLAIDEKKGNLTFCYDSLGTPLSAMLTLVHNKTRYYQFGATDPQYRSSSASVFLMLNNIRKAYEEDIDYFDMVGINSPNRGDFKLSFSAQPESYFVAKGTFIDNLNEFNL